MRSSKFVLAAWALLASGALEAALVPKIELPKDSPIVMLGAEVQDLRLEPYPVQ